MNNFQIPLGNQPIDPALLIIIKAHQRKSRELKPLSKITNAIDGRYLKIDNTRARLNAEPSRRIAATSKKRASDFGSSSETFIHAVRVLMTGYAMVPSKDPLGNTWCSFNAAQQHISTVEARPRASSESNHQMFHRVMGAEMSVRSEWARVPHAETSLSLSQIIATVSQRHTLWPTFQEFRAHGKGRPGGNPIGAPPHVDPKGEGRRKPWTREQRQLFNKKTELEFQGECVLVPQLCSNHRKTMQNNATRYPPPVK